MADAIVICGERIGGINEYEPGNGTYVRGEFIYSKLVGRKSFVEEVVDGTKKTKVSVNSGDESRHFVPEIGDFI